MQLHALHDQTLQHLTLQHILRRQWRSLFLQLLERGGEACPQFDIGDDIVADDGDDAVGFDGRHRRSENGMRQQATKAAEEDKQGADE